MYIESLIKPSKTPTRTVSVFGTLYEFTPLAKNRFFALVEDPAACERLLANPKAYREYTDKVDVGSSLSRSRSAEDSEPKPTTTTPPAPAPVAPPKTPAPAPTPVDMKPIPPPAPDAPDASATASADTAAAQALLASTPVAIKKQLEKNLPSRAVLTEAIAIEKAATKPRVHVVANLTGVLSSLDA